MPLQPLPDARETLVVIGTSVRKNLPILSAHLKSLDWQDLPPRVRLMPVYVPDFIDGQDDARELLMRWVNERGGELLRGHDPTPNDFSDSHPESHQWSATAMARVGANKNLILQRARELRADYAFYCDSDLILDRTTLASLIASEKPIATAVFWTPWSKGSPPQPQVWLQHPYGLSGRGMDEAEFRGKLVNRELTRVWGFGACTLIDHRVLGSGIDFSPLPDIPQNGLMAGEDRQFCIRAERSHIEAFADGWPDIAHCYHPEDHANIPELVARLGAPHPRLAGIGDLVSLRLRPLEPMQVGPQRYQGLPPVLIRGRLGALPLLPELEAAVLTLPRGEQKIVKVAMPLHHAFPQFRGKNRLIELSVIDVKANTPHPNL